MHLPLPRRHGCVAALLSLMLADPMLAVSSLAGCAIAVSTLATAAPARAQTRQQPPPVNPPQPEALQAMAEQKLARTPAQQKLAPELVGAAGARTPAGAQNTPRIAQRLNTERDGRIAVTISAVVSKALTDEIVRQGGTIENSSPADGLLVALIPVGASEALAQRADVKAIIPVRPLRNNGSGTVTAESEVAMGADVARRMYNVTGSGVRVCVISDGVDALAQSQAPSSQNLPSDVKILNNVAGSGNEGTAMLEIIHDIAPDAALTFAAQGNNLLSFRDAIRALGNASEGCKVIVADVANPQEPPFQDGIAAQAVTEVSDKGILYFSSASNYGNQNSNTSGTWEGDFNPGRAYSFDVPFGGQTLHFSGTLHRFPGGSDFAYIYAPGLQSADLFWNDPWDAPTNDYDLLVFSRDANGNLTLISPPQGIATQAPGLGQPPHEFVRGVQAGLYLAIFKRDGAAPRSLRLAVNKGHITPSTWGATAGNSASDAANAFSVAAVSAHGRTTAFTAGEELKVAPYSSDGSRQLFFDKNGQPARRQAFKPDITAADDVATSVPGYERFPGTSAAAPAAAAVAALMLSLDPRPTPAQIRRALYMTALPIQPNSPDGQYTYGGIAPGNLSGYGIVRADLAVREALRLTKFASRIAGGLNHYLVLGRDGTVAAAGTDQNGSVTRANGVRDVKAIAAGSDFSLLLKSDGTVLTSGGGLELGPMATPPDVRDVRLIGAGRCVAYALQQGRLRNWVNRSCAHGQDFEPQYWNSGFRPNLRNLPRYLSQQHFLMDMAGDFFNGGIGIWSDGQTSAWSYYNLPPDIALSLPAKQNVVAAARGAEALVMLRNNGTVAQTILSATEPRFPEVPSGLDDVIAIASGYYHVLALKRDGTVAAWGRNSGGQLNIPTGLNNVVAIAAHGQKNYALKADGSVVTWGGS